VKITRITPIHVDRCLLVRVHTDEGLVGTGEAGLWAHHRLVYEAITDLAEYYVGKDAGLIEHHYQAVSRDTHFSGAILSAALSAIDIALWDILGKSVGKPVHQLLGGKVRDKVRVFANVSGETPEARGESASAAVARGYTSLRTTPFFNGWEAGVPSKYIGDAVAIVRAIREAVGFEIDLGLEIHRNLDPGEAVVLANELAPYRILYYEDPVAPESLEALRYVARHVSLPIATGERCHTLFQFKELLDTGTVSMIRPDLSLAGGFTQLKKIAALAEAAFVGIFPHLMGSPVNLAAYAQLGASVPNYALMERGVENLNEIVEEPLAFEDGYILVPARPGIGVELREDKLANFPHRAHRISPTFRADGSVAH
jgi:galactonate dehydratase